jgi:hypothetical protein
VSQKRWRPRQPHLNFLCAEHTPASGAATTDSVRLLTNNLCWHLGASPKSEASTRSQTIDHFAAGPMSSGSFGYSCDHFGPTATESIRGQEGPLQPSVEVRTAQLQAAAIRVSLQSLVARNLEPGEVGVPPCAVQLPERPSPYPRGRSVLSDGHEVRSNRAHGASRS